METTDLFLYDLKLMDNELHQKYTGVSNTLILHNLQQLNERRKTIWLRVPIIPTITSTQKNIIDILEYVTNLTSIVHIHLLPYHRIAEGNIRSSDYATTWSVLISPIR